MGVGLWGILLPLHGYAFRQFSYKGYPETVNSVDEDNNRHPCISDIFEEFTKESNSTMHGSSYFCKIMSACAVQVTYLVIGKKRGGRKEESDEKQQTGSASIFFF